MWWRPYYFCSDDFNLGATYWNNPWQPKSLYNVLTWVTLFSLHFIPRYLHNYSPLKAKRQINDLVQLYLIEKNDQRRYKYIVLGRGKSYLVNTLWSYQTFLWNRYHQNARAFDWHHICYVWLTVFFIRKSAFLWYQLCSSSRRLVPIFIRGIPQGFFFKKNKIS